MIETIVFPNCEEMSRYAAQLLVNILRSELKTQERAVFIPSAGRTPKRLYAMLRKEHRNSLDWSRVCIVQMDEYLGLPCNHPASFAHSLTAQLVEPLGIGQSCFFNDDAGRLSLPLEARAGMIKDMGGAGVTLFGIGRNGHLGFNEPGSPFESLTRAVELAPSTVEANRDPIDAMGIPVPKWGLTLGLKTLVEAREAVVIASGHEKREAVKALLSPEGMDTCLPASVLKQHGRASLLLDAEAAGHRTPSGSEATLNTV